MSELAGVGTTGGSDGAGVSRSAQAPRSARAARTALPFVVALCVLGGLASLGWMLLQRVSGMLTGQPLRIGFWTLTAQEPQWPWVVVSSLPVLVALSGLTFGWSRRGVRGAWRAAPAPTAVTVAGVVMFVMGVALRAELLTWSGAAWVLTGVLALAVDLVRWPAGLVAVTAVEAAAVAQVVGARRPEIVGLVASVVSGACLVAAAGVVVGSGPARQWPAIREPQSPPWGSLRPRLRWSARAVSLLGVAVIAGVAAAALLGDQWSSWRSPRTLAVRSYELTSVASSPDGRYLATVTGYGTLELDDLVTGTRARRTLDQGSGWARFSADGRHVFVLTYQGNAYTWEISDAGPGAWHRRVGTAADGTTVFHAVAADGTAVSVDYGRDVVLLAPSAGPLVPKRLSSLRASAPIDQGSERTAAAPLVMAAAVRADGGVAAAGYDDGQVVVADTRQDRVLLALPPAPAGGLGRVWVPYRDVVAGAVCAVALAPDGRTVAVATVDGRIRLVDVAGGRTRAELQRSLFSADVGRAQALEFSADGRHLLAGYLSGAVQLWTLPTSVATTSP